MKISIITVNYNNAAGLQLTIDSVLSQTLDLRYSLEYLIIDGGSTDGSTSIINCHSSSIDFWVSEKDRGVYHAMNKGIVNSTGEYLIFLNSGDYFLHKNILAECVSSIFTEENIDIYYGDTLIMYHNVNTRHMHPSKLDLTFLRKDTINHQASLIRRKLFDEFGLYPEQYKLASDYWLYLLAFLEGKKYKYIGTVIVFYDINGMSASNGFEKYTEERNLIWYSLLSSNRHLNLLTEEFDKLLKDTSVLQSIVSRRIIKFALFIDKIIGVAKRIIENKFF